MTILSTATRLPKDCNQSATGFRLVRGPAADALLAEDRFHKQWSELCRQCPWTTAFQTPGLCATWYEVYRPRFEPLFVFAHDEDAQLVGLLPLAVDQDGRPVNVGAWQAEYQGWICRPELGERFPWQALQMVRREFARSVLRFGCLPPQTPIGWATASEAASFCWLKSLRGPILRLGDGSEIAASLKKKSNRSRLNRLERLGPLQFQRISDPNALDGILDWIAHAYDLRQATIHGSTPFRNDPLKRPFYLAMMRTPGLLHATLLKAGDRLVAVHLGPCCGSREVELGILVYDPGLARHSPGKFHLLFLAQMLREEGFEQLALTTGADSYKDRLANRYEHVHRLVVFPSAGQRRKHALREGGKEAARRVLQACQVEPRQLRSFRSRLRGACSLRGSLKAMRAAARWIHSRREVRVYACEAASIPDVDIPGIRRDALDDLLGYHKEGPDALPRQEFLTQAMDRLEEGHHVYTCGQNRRLVHHGWLVGPCDTLPSDEAGHLIPSRNQTCILDLPAPIDAIDRASYAALLRKMLRDAARLPGVVEIHIAVRADDLLGRQTVEEAGAAYVHSRFETVHFGRTLPE